MTPSEILSPTPSYIGHVRNGIVVLDAQVSLVEGQAVHAEHARYEGYARASKFVAILQAKARKFLSHSDS